MSADSAEFGRVDWSGVPVNQSVASFIAHEERVYSGLASDSVEGLRESVDSVASADSLDLRAADKQSIEAFFKPESTSSKNSSSSSKVLVGPPGEKLQAYESTIVTMINNNNRCNINVNQNLRIRVAPKSSSAAASSGDTHPDPTPAPVMIYNAVKIEENDPLRLVSFKGSKKVNDSSSSSGSDKKSSSGGDKENDDDDVYFVYRAAIRHPNDVVKARPFREQAGYVQLQQQQQLLQQQQLQQQQRAGSGKFSAATGFPSLPALPGLIAPSSSSSKKQIGGIASSMIDDAQSSNSNSSFIYDDDDDESSYGPVRENGTSVVAKKSSSEASIKGHADHVYNALCPIAEGLSEDSLVSSTEIFDGEFGLPAKSGKFVQTGREIESDNITVDDPVSVDGRNSVASGTSAVSRIPQRVRPPPLAKGVAGDERSQPVARRPLGVKDLLLAMPTEQEYSDMPADAPSSVTNATAFAGNHYQDYFHLGDNVGELRPAPRPHAVAAQSRARSAAARRAAAALTIQRVYRGHVGRGIALVRRVKLMDRFRCANCGRAEQGGGYCKGCGRRKVHEGGAARPVEHRYQRAFDKQQQTVYQYQQPGYQHPPSPSRGFTPPSPQYQQQQQSAFKERERRAAPSGDVRLLSPPSNRGAAANKINDFERKNDFNNFTPYVPPPDDVSWTPYVEKPKVQPVPYNNPQRLAQPPKQQRHSNRPPFLQAPAAAAVVAPVSAEQEMERLLMEELHMIDSNIGRLRRPAPNYAPVAAAEVMPYGDYPAAVRQALSEPSSPRAPREKRARMKVVEVAPIKRKERAVDKAKLAFGWGARDFKPKEPANNPAPQKNKDKNKAGRRAAVEGAIAESDRRVNEQLLDQWQEAVERQAAVAPKKPLDVLSAPAANPRGVQQPISINKASYLKEYSKRKDGGPAAPGSNKSRDKRNGDIDAFSVPDSRAAASEGQQNGRQQAGYEETLSLPPIVQRGLQDERSNTRSAPPLFPPIGLSRGARQ